MKLPAKYIFIFSPYTPRTSFLYTRVSGKFLSYGATDTAGGRYNNKSGVCARVKFVRGGEIIHTRCTYTPRCTGTPSRPRKGRAQTEKRKCAHAHTRRQLFAGFFFFPFSFRYRVVLSLSPVVRPSPTHIPSLYVRPRTRGRAERQLLRDARARNPFGSPRLYPPPPIHERSCRPIAFFFFLPCPSSYFSLRGSFVFERRARATWNNNYILYDPAPVVNPSGNDENYAVVGKGEENIHHRFSNSFHSPTILRIKTKMFRAPTKLLHLPRQSRVIKTILLLPKHMPFPCTQNLRFNYGPFLTERRAITARN